MHDSISHWARLWILRGLALILAPWGALAAEPSTNSTLIAEQRAFIQRFSARPRSTWAERAAAADMLESELRRRGLNAERHPYRRSNVHFTLDLLMPPVQGQNVVTHIPATAPSGRYVIVGAHYDSVAGSPGANDNASGVAAALSLASALAALPQRRIHFLIVWFDQEEDGGSGSSAFVDKVLGEHLDVHSMHNIDMVGWDSNGDRAVEMELPTPQLQALYLDAGERLGIAVDEVRYNSSDHLPFRQAGIDAVCLSEQFGAGDSTPHHHAPTDVLSSVNLEYLASSTRLLIEAMSVLAAEP